MITKTENKILLKEIETLKKQNKSMAIKLGIANKSKKEYEELVEQLNNCKKNMKNHMKKLKI